MGIWRRAGYASTSNREEEMAEKGHLEWILDTSVGYGISWLEPNGLEHSMLALVFCLPRAQRLKKGVKS